MKTAKLPLSPRTVAEKIDLATRVGNAIILNEAAFPAPPIPPSDLQDLAVTLQDAISDVESARERLHENLTVERAAETALDAALGKIVPYVQSIGDANVSIQILGEPALAGRRTSPPGALASPEGLTAREGLFTGEIVLRWKRVSGAQSYCAEFRPASGTAGWKSVGASASTKLVVEGLKSGVRYFFRVAAVGQDGQGRWSAEVSWSAA